ncbi:MAG: toll/interleukin-1 receptor domain-containing protein [Lachnospiraceae bacterium]|nr:toll/interleukin-1 receptor domain-containing protein [Lachnospiraceae bacterium]
MEKTTKEEMKKEQTTEQVTEQTSAQGETVREYIAFISYRHKDLDKQVAKKVHTMLERYHVPKELQKDGIGPRLGRVFRDEEELPVSSDLTASIQTALDHSKFLLVVCTPDTLKSVWVEQEINYFVKKHGREHLIGILVNGTPEESFPVPLTTDFAEDGKTVVRITEPLAANLTDVHHVYDGRRLKKEIMRLYAAILGCPFDSLWQRERRHKQRVAITALSAITCGLVAFSSYVYMKNRQITLQNQQITEQNEQITEQNAEIQSQNSELKRREAEAMIREGSALIDSGKSRNAVKRILTALESEEGRESYSTEAFGLLQDALAAGQYSNKMRTVGRVTQDNEIKLIKLSETGEYLFTRDYLGLVRCYRVADETLIWRGDSLSGQLYRETVKRDRMLVLEHVEAAPAAGTDPAETSSAGWTGIILFCDEGKMTALSMQDGSLLWNYDLNSMFMRGHFQQSVDFSCVSADGSRAAVIEINGLEESASSWVSGLYEQAEVKLTVLNTADGTVAGQILLPQEIQDALADKVSLKAAGSCVGTFSEDGNYVIGGIYTYDLGSDYQAKTYYFIADLQAGTSKLLKVQKSASYAEAGDYAQLLLGFYPDDANKRVLIWRYDGGQQELCMDEIFWDGKQGNSTVLAKELLQGITEEREWISTFNTEHPRAIMATFGTTRVIYGKEDVSLWGHQDYSYSIMNHQYLNRDDWSQWTFGVVTEDGTMQCIYGSGVAAYHLTDKQHFAQLEITDGYVSTHSAYGHTIDQDAVAAVVCDDDLNTVYFMQSANDPHIAIADRSKVQGAEAYATYDLENGSLAFCATTEEDAVIRIVDAASGKEQNEYRFPLADFEDLRYLTSSRNKFLFWQDGRHLSVFWNHAQVLDMETGQWEPVYGGTKVYNSQILRMGEHILQVGLVPDPEKPLDAGENILYSGGYALNRLCWRTGAGELQERTLETEKCLGSSGLTPAPYLAAGENGMVLVGQYADAQQETMDSFLVYDIAEDNQYVLEDACPGDAKRVLAMAKEQPFFATIDTDGMLRIYDIKEQAVKREIRLKDGGTRVERMTFCAQDRAICVFEKDHFIIYDLASGWLVYEESIQGTGYSSAVELRAVDDPARNRTYLILSSKAALCVDTVTWQKIAYYTGVDVFCPETNQVYIVNQGVRRIGEEEGIAVLTAYTLDDLIAWGKEW